MSARRFHKMLAVSAAFSLWSTAMTPVALCAESANKPAQPVKMLSGRLEELVGQGARLPVGTSVKGLKSQSGRVDPKLSSGMTKSYPESFVGNWGGQLKVISSQHVQSQPFAPSVAAGNEGLVFFRFTEPNNKSVMLEPSKVYFPPVSARLGDTRLGAGDAERLATLDPDTIIKHVPTLILGNGHTKDLSGEQTFMAVLKDTLRTLKPGVMEQNIVVRCRQVDPNAQTVEYGYLETVVRMTCYRPDLMWAQIGYVYYDDSGEPGVQMILQGWMSRNWKVFAKQLEGMTGRTLEDVEGAWSTHGAAAKRPLLLKQGH